MKVHVNIFNPFYWSGGDCRENVSTTSIFVTNGTPQDCLGVVDTVWGGSTLRPLWPRLWCGKVRWISRHLLRKFRNICLEHHWLVDHYLPFSRNDNQLDNHDRNQGNTVKTKINASSESLDVTPEAIPWKGNPQVMTENHKRSLRPRLARSYSIIKYTAKQNASPIRLRSGL